MRQCTRLVPIAWSFDQNIQGIRKIVTVSCEGHHITCLACSCNIYTTDPLVVRTLIYINVMQCD